MTPSILNFGSINIDHVYRVEHFVQPGETLASTELNTGLGGKGANQSVAIAKAGVAVKHIGRVSKADRWAVESMAAYGVDITDIALVDEPSGHAMIQVDPAGENAIVLHGGANQTFSENELTRTLTEHRDADFLLMQNETNLLDHALTVARKSGLKIVLNPAPMTAEFTRLRLTGLDTLIVNQIEAQALSNKTDTDDIINELRQRFPDTRLVLTLGAKGAILIANNTVIQASATATSVIDTTGAGDTFVGYFLAGVATGLSDAAALQRACDAAALSVTRAGAIASIPDLSELTSTHA